VNTPTLSKAVADLLAQLEALPEGVYGFSFTPATNLLAASGVPAPRPPVLTMPATADTLGRCLSAFEHWEGIVQIGALHCEGLPPDFWIY